jgi:hypothetical protein
MRTKRDHVAAPDLEEYRDLRNEIEKNTTWYYDVKPTPPERNSLEKET